MSTRTSFLAPGHPYRVLVCDDEPHTQRLLQACLEARGIRVSKASNGIQALIRLRNETYDLMILDVLMPDMNGYEVLKEVRTDPSLADLPVIMLTAQTHDKAVFEGYHHGADMYLTKPFNPSELLGFISRLA
jgi:two-component system, OmpR family, alkaline phosphatase synthesis response regulator PhoP